MKESQKFHLWRSCSSALLFASSLLCFARSPLRADSLFTVVDADGNGKQTVTLSGASSVDPDGAIIDYTWKVNNVVVGSGYGPSVQNLTFDFSLGTTTVLLTVRDDAQDSASTTARVAVLPPSSTATIPSPPPDTNPSPAPGIDVLAGHTFTRTAFLKKFSFDPPYQNFSGITLDDVTGTYFVTESSGVIFEINPDGTLRRTIDISGLDRTGIPADPEGIAWMHGQTFAIALHDAKEIAVIDIAPGATRLSRNQATIYDVSAGPGKPKGVCYVAREDAFYWVAKDAPKAVMKARISGGQWQTLWTKIVDGLPAIDLADVAYTPKLSPYLFLISESSQTVMEVDLTGPTAVLKSSMSLAAWPIPQAGGLAFGPNGKMVIVGKHVRVVSQDDFNVFDPSPAVGNQPPWVFASIPAEIFGDGTGKASIRVDASASFDPEDDPLTRYRWTLDSSSTVYDGPNAIETLTFETSGPHVLNLDVFSTAGAVSQSRRASYNVLIDLNPAAVGTSPLPGNGPAVSLNYIHPGSTVQHAEFVFNLSAAGHAEIRIFDPLGREIKKINSDEVPAGSYQEAWDLTNENGAAVSSGVYFVLIKTPGQTKREKVVVVR